MKVEVLGAYGGESADCRMTCLLIDDVVALDAGSLSQALPVERQRSVEAIVLTHSHLDHTCSLPFFVENIYERGREAVDIWATEETIYAIRKSLFNNTSWPDFSRMPNNLLPAMRFRALEPEEPVEIGGIRFTPIPVDHLVPTCGFLIERGDAKVLWSSDTGPTHRLWEVANQTPGLAAICLEVSFDNSMETIADVSFHLTPQRVAAELEKLRRPLPVLLHHLKPPCIEPIHREIAALANPRLQFLEQGRTYNF